MLVAVKLIGFRQVGAGAQVTLATHPELVNKPSLLNLKVKQPELLDEVNGPGIVVPQKAPGVVKGPKPKPFVLDI